jgi:hypothetical protein
LGSRAAQNAALGLLLLSSQAVGVESLAGGALVDTGSSTIGLTDNLGLPKCANHRVLSRPPSRRQPFISREPNQEEDSATFSPPSSHRQPFVARIRCNVNRGDSHRPNRA